MSDIEEFNCYNVRVGDIVIIEGGLRGVVLARGVDKFLFGVEVSMALACVPYLSILEASKDVQKISKESIDQLKTQAMFI